jgi:hypothetical protein
MRYLSTLQIRFGLGCVRFLTPQCIQCHLCNHVLDVVSHCRISSGSFEIPQKPSGLSIREYLSPCEDFQFECSISVCFGTASGRHERRFCHLQCFGQSPGHPLPPICGRVSGISTSVTRRNLPYIYLKCFEGKFNKLAYCVTLPSCEDVVIGSGVLQG